MSLLIIAKVALLLVLTLALLQAFRNTSASLRYVVLLAGLMAALILPAIEQAVPDWRVLPAEARSIVENPAAIPARVTQAVTPQTEAQPAAGIPAVQQASMEIVTLVKIGWLGGAALMLLTLFSGAMRLTMSVRSAPTLFDPAWQQTLEEGRAALGIRREVALKARPEGSMPAVWGLLSPSILLPEDCVTWSADRRQAVLMHELGHIARHDVVVSLLVNAACALHWFNPLVWVLKRKLEEEREQACDDYALAHGMPRTLYAKQLLETAAGCQRHRSLAPVMAGKSQLEGRIMSILDKSRERAVARPRTQIIMTFMMMIAMLAVSSVTFAESGRLWDRVKANGDTNPIFADFAELLAVEQIDVDDRDALVTALESEDPMVRAAVAWALGSFKDDSVIDPLVEAGYDRNEIVRLWAVRSLSYRNDPRILSLYIDRLQDSYAEVRQWSVRSMRVFDAASTKQPLLDALNDRDAEVREYAVRELALFADTEIVTAMTTLLQVETNPDVAEWIVRSLVGRQEPGAVAALKGALQSPTADVREWAVRSLAGSGDPTVGETMAALLQVESNPDVAEWAVRSLSGRSDQASQSALIGALQSPTADVREWAARGLAGSTDAPAVNALIAALGDSKTDVREWSVRALGVCGNDAALVPLESMKSDPDSEVREWADRSIETIRCGS